MSHSLRQPKALLPLCTTEMWERFGFYTIQTLLVFLIIKHFHQDDATASLITGEYGALVFISPAIGGYFADKVLGFRYTIMMGCIFQFLGYLCLALLTLKTVYMGLSLVILGNGFLKANIASYLGAFYKEKDARRRAGFTYYYMGMNTGTFIGTLISGFVQAQWSWQITFMVAAFGMLIANIIFKNGFKRFGDVGLPTNKKLVFENTISFIGITTILCLTITLASYFLLQHARLGSSFLLGLAIITLTYLIYSAMQHAGKERRNLVALTIFLVFATIFWAIFFEMFSAINLFMERAVDREIFGIIFPPASFISLEPIYIVLIGFPLASLWKYLHRIQRDISMTMKFVLALLTLAIAMKLLNVAIDFPNSNSLVYPAWMFLFFFLITLGEMLLSPNLLSAVTELSPKKITGFMMGVQYMAIGFGSAITGLLAQLAAIPQGLTDANVINVIYGHAFNTYALICLISATVILLISPLLSRLTTH